MDYRALLKKYIDHVGSCEGVTFISWIDKEGGGTFSAEEAAELHKLSEEVDAEWAEANLL